MLVQGVLRQWFFQRRESPLNHDIAGAQMVGEVFLGGHAQDYAILGGKMLGC